jgi:dolichol kinase
LIHASTALVIVVGLVWGWRAFRDLMTLTATLAVVVETARITTPLGKRLESWIPVFRPGERRRPSGAFWLALGYALAAWFPAPASVAGILCGALADPAAAWAGASRKGRANAPPAGPKTWVGSSAAAATGCLVLLLTGFGPLQALLAAVGGAALERWSRPLDDNLVIAPGVAALVWLLSLT